VLLVADDAHRSPNVAYVLALAKEVSTSRTVKLLLTTRPSGLSFLDAQITRTFDVTQVKRFPALERLSKQQVCSLATEVLGPDQAFHVDRLVELSGDTPLVTVIGGRLISQGEIQPDAVVNEDDFRHAVFDKFIEEYERSLPTGPVRWRDLLNLIAALQPAHLRSEAFITAEKFLGNQKHELLSAIDMLENHGLLLRGGDLIRIVPDVLADYVLENACVDRTGRSTGYSDAIFKAFGETDLSSLLRNLSELDWRITQKGPSAGLLRDVWQTLFERFASGDAKERMLLLKSVGDAAFFQPDETHNLVKMALATIAPTHTYLGDWSITNDAVLDELPAIMERIAYHQRFTRHIADRLWDLAQVDSGERLNPYHKAAARALENLARYASHKSVSF